MDCAERVVGLQSSGRVNQYVSSFGAQAWHIRKTCVGKLNQVSAIWARVCSEVANSPLLVCLIEVVLILKISCFTCYWPFSSTRTCWKLCPIPISRPRTKAPRAQTFEAFPILFFWPWLAYSCSYISHLAVAVTSERTKLSYWSYESWRCSPGCVRDIRWIRCVGWNQQRESKICKLFSRKYDQQFCSW